MKRLTGFILAMIIAVTAAISVSADQGVISIGRVVAEMPDITVEVAGSGYAASNIDAHLDNEKLEVRAVEKYDSKTNSTCVYALVDLSTSMWSTFALVKKNLVSHIEAMGENDTLVLMAFGETEVKTILSGDESKEDAVSAVNALQCNENGTLFYEALSKAYQLSTSKSGEYDREYVLAFSDGIDYQKGSTTFGEVKKLYESRALPLYAACAVNASKDAADAFGEMARASGGELSIIGDENQFAAFGEKINDVTIIKLEAPSNHADGKDKQLSIKIGDSQTECRVPITRSVEDTTAPMADKIFYDAKGKVIVVEFSERVLGADKPESYKITDADGNLCEIGSVRYTEANSAAEITLKNGVFNGTYEIEFPGVTDNSKEKNPLAGKQQFDVENSAAAESEGVTTTPADTAAEGEKSFPLWAIILIAAAGLLAVGGVILAVVFSGRKNDGAEEPVQMPQTPAPVVVDHMGAPAPEVKHHIKSAPGVRVRMRVKTGKTAEQTIELSIVSSIIVGRSEICDVCIDDTKMSRQHFAVEYDGKDLFITDLQSRNGTMLGGIRIGNRQKLAAGDKILAGLSDITITVIG